MDERERREINNTTMGYEEVRENKDTREGPDSLGVGRDHDQGRLGRGPDPMVGPRRKVGDNEVVATGADVDAMIHDTPRTRVTPVATSAKINQLSHFRP